MRDPRNRMARRVLPVLLVGLALAPACARADARAGEKKAELCVLCHRVDHPEAWVPTLEGQHREYLVAQLKAYKENRRINPAMQTNTIGLNERDMRDIADYFASRKPVRGSFTADPARVARGKELTGKAGCAACHGSGYQGGKEVPRLAGMEPRYVASQMTLIASGKRAHPALPALASLSPDDATGIAHYLASLD
jgi:cytochrome c553